ncbi:hypothetical protein [Streptomyces cinerochromogenes]|uniref:hypothetical protein n=1 Tax=Streptomyces cinerochromogenes TaxID=66422 RepID=UPI0033B31F21
MASSRVRRAVRDQPDRPSSHLPGRRRGRGALVGELLAHALKDPFGDREFVAFGPYVRQLLGQLFFESSSSARRAVIRFSNSGSVHRIVLRAFWRGHVSGPLS